MATYLELFALQDDSNLQDRTSVAVVKKAQTIIDQASPTSSQLTWAVEALASPKSKASELLNYALAANSALSVAQIQGASDSQLQGNIDDAVDTITGVVV